MMLTKMPASGCQMGNRRFRSSPRTVGLRIVAQQASGRTEPFNENVAQVKRLISRDRKEFLGNSQDILDKYTTEFGEGPSQPTASVPESNPFTSSAAAPATPLSSDNPFKTSTSSPFASAPAAAPKPFKQSIEPRGLTPDMSPDPVVKETPVSILKSIGLTQIVIFFSFSLIIGLMVATFFVVVNAGGVRLAGLD